MKLFSKKIIRNIAISALITPFGMGLLFLLYLVLAKQLNPADFGRVSYVLSVSAMVVIFISSGLPISAQKFIPKYISEKNNLFLRGYIVWSFFWTILSSVIAIFSISIFLNFIENDHTKENFIYIAISIFPMAIWFWQRYISLGFDLILIALLPREILYPLVSIIFLLLFNISDALTSLITINLIYAICILGGIFFMYVNISNEFKRKTQFLYEIKLWHTASLPMLLSSMMLLGLNNWDLLILGFYEDMNEIGIYAIALKLSLIISMVLRVLNTVLGQKISAHYYNNDFDALDDLFKKARGFSFTIALLSLIILIYFSKTILGYIGDEYKGATNILLILAIGQFVSSLFGPVTICLNMVDEQKASAKLLLKWSVVALILNIILIPMFSLYGAAIANATTVSGLKLQQFLYFKRFSKRLRNNSVTLIQ